MQLRDLMELIRTAESLVSYDTGLGQERGNLDTEHYRKLPPQEFEEFMADVHELVYGVVKLKETSLSSACPPGQGREVARLSR